MRKVTQNIYSINYLCFKKYSACVCIYKNTPYVCICEDFFLKSHGRGMVRGLHFLFCIFLYYLKVLLPVIA